MTIHKKLPRDAAKPAAHYVKLAGLYRKEIDAAIKLNAPAVLRSIADTHLRVARALYSSGAAAADCLAQLHGAGDFFTRDLLASQTTPIAGVPNIESYIENFSAATLAGNLAPCLEAFKRARIVDFSLWQRSLLSLVTGALVGRSERPETFDLRGAPQEWVPGFSDMVRAACKGNADAFASALNAFLKEQWGPSADRVAKADLATRPSQYIGTWAFHTAALCKVWRYVPVLSKKAKQYVPIDLA